MSRAFIRLFGLAFVIGAAAAAYWSVYLPWTVAHAHEGGRINLSTKLTVLAPAFALVGFYLLGAAPAHADSSGPEGKTPRLVMTVLMLLGVAIGFAVDYWLREQLRSMGYMSAG